MGGNPLWEVAAPNSLRAQGEGGAGDGGGQVKAFGDLPPDLLVDDLHQPTLLRHQLVEHVEIQDLLGHDGDPVDGSSCREEKGSMERVREGKRPRAAWGDPTLSQQEIQGICSLARGLSVGE